MGLISENFGKGNASLRTIVEEEHEAEAEGLVEEQQPEEEIEESSLLKNNSQRGEQGGVKEEPQEGEEGRRGDVLVGMQEEGKGEEWRCPSIYYFNPFMGMAFYPVASPTPMSFHSGKLSSFSFCSMNRNMSSNLSS